MAGVKKCRRQRLRKTKAQLVDELESLERELDQARSGNDGGPSSSSAGRNENEGLLKVITERKKTEVSLQRLYAAISALSEGVALYDADDRLVFYNKRSRKFNESIDDKLVLGIKFEDLMKSLVENDLVPDAVGREDEWIEQRLEKHRNPGESFELQRQDGLWLLIREQRLSDGGILTLTSDISGRKRAEEINTRQARIIQESLNEIYMFDVETLNFIQVNPGALENLGYTMEEMQGMTPVDIKPEVSREELLQRIKPLEEAGSSRIIFETLHQRKDGTTYDAEVHLQLMRDEKRPFFYAIIQDISERKQAEQALKESEVRFKSFAEVAADWFWEMDEDFRFTYLSGCRYEVLGYNDEDLIGRKRGDLTSEQMADSKWQRHMTELEAHRPFNDFCYELLKPDGGTVHVSISGAPVFDGHGVFKGYLGTGTDISKRQQVEADLLTAKEQAEFANRAKTEFLANMSHELRTPLNSILGFSEVMMRETLGSHGISKYREYAEDIHYSGSHLLSLIGEVLDLSKLEVGEFGIHESQIDVTETIRTCLKMVEGRSDDKRICLSAIVSAGLPRLYVDELRFKQILLNLLGNAIKFTPPAGEVAVSARLSKNGEFVVEVSDTGIGISAQDIPKVLEPFGQVYDVMTRNHEGSGLGLHLAKSFTEIHGGTLEIESTIGAGTNVILTFPSERTIRPEQERTA